jgi:hypothetical protein
MFFLNLTAGEFFTLLGALGGFVTALYLLDRTKRKKVVSTLRFWTAALTAEERQSRKRMREPWSLVLQLLSLLLLLLAIAQLQWGTRERRGRDHVLLLDTSSWTAERAETAGTLLDREKNVAERYVATLAAEDRALLVRVDGLATPIGSFTSDRMQLLEEIRASTSGYSALNMDQALSVGRQAQSWSGGQPGEIVYIGPELIADADGAPPKLPNLRIIPVEANRENCGIRRIGVKRNEQDANSWQATVVLKNYGSNRRTLRLKTQFAGTRFAPRVLMLAGGEERSAEYNFVTNTAGRLIAEIEPGDALASDDRAEVELPRNGLLNVGVFTKRPEILAPLLEANHRLNVKFFGPGTGNAGPADVLVLDGVAPKQQSKIAALWIDPPKEQSPLPVKSVIADAVVKTWHSETALGTGLRAKEAHVPAAEVFETFDSDIAVASVAEGPIVVARPATENRAKLAVIGFDPLDRELKFEVTTPLLFANLLRWLAPEAFRTLDITAGRVGGATVTLDPSEHAERIHVSDQRRLVVPFTVRDQSLQLFASRPSIVRVVSDDRERILSLTLPDVAEFRWKPPVQTAQGFPPAGRFAAASVELWGWLAVLGGIGLFVEWMLFGRRRVLKWRSATRESRRQTIRTRERELVAK